MPQAIHKIMAMIAITVSFTAWADMPKISNLLINPTPPGAKVSAAYLHLHNPNSGALTLFDVSSPVIKRVEIHKSEIVNDVATMRQQKEVIVGAQDSVAFKHGGLHIMLMGLEAPMMPGEEIPLVFHTSEGDLTINAFVAESIILPSDGSHSDMNHDAINHDSKNLDATKQDQNQPGDSAEQKSTHNH